MLKKYFFVIGLTLAISSCKIFKKSESANGMYPVVNLDTIETSGKTPEVPQYQASVTRINDIIHTKLGDFLIHQISSPLFDGFDWYKGEGNFLIAEPEKALIDSLYLSSRKKKQYGSFPELDFPPEFSFRKAVRWAELISEKKIRLYVLAKLKTLRTAKAHYQ